MATVLSLKLAKVPTSFNAATPGSIKDGLTKTEQRNLELIGPKFQAFVRRRFHKRTFSEDEKIQQEIYGNDQGDDEDLSEDEEEPADMKNLDPRDWKSQDHYQLLGLSKYRYKATDDQIKRAFHKKVLRHHPDKKAASGNTNDDRVFKCIQKAYEILTNKEKRRQYDSVDEFYPDTFPTSKTKGDFFELWTPVFEREGRFSKKQPVPELGDIDSPRDQVEAFYDFFYNMESWRSFEYLDKEDADGDNRDNKRYIEQKNKKERAQRKKEDGQRFLKLIDTAISLDPRIIKFKQEDKDKRAAKKKPTKAQAEKAALEAKAKQEEEERKAKEKVIAESKEKAAKEKKDKEALKKAIRKVKKAIRELSEKANHFLPETPTPAQAEEQLAKLELVFEKVGPNLEALNQLKTRAEEAINSKTQVGFLERESA
ncbi:DnaJ-domain-containing protein [Neoconidiobolus thromboides FSU 785]|nr:DnaJ-domain-containing protein [Neoconidiobolus thromboides FSU 785]